MHSASCRAIRRHVQSTFIGLIQGFASRLIAVINTMTIGSSRKIGKQSSWCYCVSSWKVNFTGSGRVSWLLWVASSKATVTTRNSAIVLFVCLRNSRYAAFNRAITCRKQSLVTTHICFKRKGLMISLLILLLISYHYTPCHAIHSCHSFIHPSIHSFLIRFEGLGANHDHWTSTQEMSNKISNCSKHLRKHKVHT